MRHESGAHDDRREPSASVTYKPGVTHVLFLLRVVGKGVAGLLENCDSR